MAESDWQIHMAEQIGSLNSSVQALTAAITTLNSQVDSGREERSKIARDVAHVSQKLDEFEPDMKRCRMFRNFGAVSVILIAAVVSLLEFWNHIKDAFLYVVRGGS